MSSGLRLSTLFTGNKQQLFTNPMKLELAFLNKHTKAYKMNIFSGSVNSDDYYLDYK